MSTTNHTLNYELSQYVDGDVTSYLTNYNSDMTKIDAQMKRNADSAQTAEDNATIAVSTATTAASNASTALSTANSANATAESAQTAAQNAQTASGQAQTDAAAALRASASNSITNLAPTYDSTLTYGVGDLVTYIFSDTNHGHLYKCIVAVTVPEEFDVNKWDDVTTSEIYGRKSSVIASHTVGAAAETYKVILDDLYTQAENSRSFNKETILLIKTSSGVGYCHQRVNDSQTLQYFDFSVGAAGANTATITDYILSADSNVRKANFTSTGLTTTDGSSSIITNTEFEIVELGTV